MQKRMWAIKAARVLSPLVEYRPGIVLMNGREIAAVGSCEHVTIPDGVEVIDVGDRIIVPGFVDIHIHGAIGHRVEYGTEATLEIADFLPSTGTTAWLPTLLQGQGIPGVVAAMSAQEHGAEIVGIHMEGPYLAPKQLPHEGTVTPPVPNVEELEALFAAARGCIRLMGIAPELANSHAVIGAIRKMGIMPAVAHSKADYNTFCRAVGAGIRHATHTYNVMTGLHHRKPGIVGGVLTHDAVTAELIADGYHVHPAAMSVLIRCKGPQSVAIITDSSRYQGLPDGDYEQVIKKDGMVRLKGYDSSVDNTLAGSVWPMNRGVANVAMLPHVTLQDAVQMASLTPARVVGIANRKGSLEPGKDADLVVIDDHVNVYMTVVGGRLAYQEA